MGTEGELTISPALVIRPAARLRFDAWSYGKERVLEMSLGGRQLGSGTVGQARTRVSIIVPAGTGPGVVTLTVDPPAEPVAVRGLDSLYAVGLAVAESTLEARAVSRGRRP
jgi:hypothetical protein